MTDNKSKQKTKKASKSVLDYDPLAWLGEGDDEEDLDTVKKVTTVKKSQIKPVVAKKKMSNKKSKKESTVTSEASDVNNEDMGFGFFDNEPEPVNNLNKTEVEKMAESNTESEDGFGFFETSDDLGSQSAELDNTNNVINLGAELTIRSVTACKQIIDESLAHGFDIKIAAGDLQKIDTAGLQLLYSLSTTLEKTSQSINWVSSNSIINDAAQLIGMPKLLETSEDEGGFGFF